MNRFLDRLELRALGTTCVLATNASALDLAVSRAALAAGRDELEACERALSRFDPRSDLSRLNREAGAWVRVDGRLVEALEAAIVMRAATGGRCDPTVLPALVAAGYDRSYEQLGESPALPPPPAGGSIELDVDHGRARLARGTAVDLGASAKGYIAGRVLGAMRRAWHALPGALVDLGGDVAVVGVPPGPGPWRVDVENPRPGGGVLGTVELDGGGVATSGPSRRRFGPGRMLHHLIDPRSGVPVRGGPLAATVVAADPLAADAHATALAVTTLDDAEEYLDARPELGAVLVPDEGPPRLRGAIRFQSMAGVLLVCLLVALVAGCGGTSSSSRSESAPAFMKRITTEFARGQSSRLWADLAPAEQAVVPRTRFLACRRNTGFRLRTFKVLDSYEESFSLLARSVPSTAVSVQVTSDDGVTTATMHAIHVDGRWRWVLQPADLAAYRAGRCP